MVRSLVALASALFVAASPLGAVAHDGISGMHDDAQMPHMALSAPRAAKPGDAARANAILGAARTFMKRYTDVAAARRDGFVKFAPDVELPLEHFTKTAFAAKAYRGDFDPTEPTSLIYERDGAKLTLVGVMYTANPRASEDALDAMVPLSVARWHRHVNFCFKPGQEAALGGDVRFGMGGAIDTKAACDAAGGFWRAQLFGWMVHAWPLERDPKKRWAVEDPDGKGAMEMGGMRM